MRIVDELGEWFDVRLDNLISTSEEIVQGLKLSRNKTENELWTEKGVEGESTLDAIGVLLRDLMTRYDEFHEALVDATGVAAPDGLTWMKEKIKDNKLVKEVALKT